MAQQRRRFRARTANSIIMALCASILMMRSVDASPDGPVFDEYFPIPRVAQLVDTPFGQLYLTASAAGFEAMAEPKCRAEKGLGQVEFVVLARKLLIAVDDAFLKANDTGLDSRAAENVYASILGPERQKRVIEFSARRSEPATAPYAIARLRRDATSVLWNSVHKIWSSLQFLRYPESAKFAHFAFDDPRIFQLSMASSQAFEDATKALPQLTQEDLREHGRAANSARTKATDFGKANRLGPKDVHSLIEADLEQHCIRTPAG